MMKLGTLASVFLALSCVAAAESYGYARTGNSQDVHTRPESGIAMMGGGSDLDEAFRWLCAKADGGDFLILRTAGADDYNRYVARLCKLNSVATLIIPDRNTAQDPRVSELIRSAEAIFIAGGDQARYVNFWKGTSVEDALNANIADRKPIGGTSAGLAVLGEFIYGALQDGPDDDDLTSAEVLRDPHFYRVTLIRGFLDLPLLKDTLTDSHFARRDRMGRSLGFLARIAQDGWSATPREIAIDEKSAVLVETNGTARVIGRGKGAYFISLNKGPDTCARGKPLALSHVRVFHAHKGGSFNLIAWTGGKGESYSLSVLNGKIHSTIGKIY